MILTIYDSSNKIIVVHKTVHAFLFVTSNLRGPLTIAYPRLAKLIGVENVHKRPLTLPSPASGRREKEFLEFPLRQEMPIKRFGL